MGIETMAAISIGSSLLGTGLGIAGQASQAQAQAAQANYQAQVARNNQTIMLRNAEIARQQGEVAAQDQGLRSRLIMGSQKAALAAQGGDVNTGSSADIIGDTAMASKTDQDTLRYNAALKAYGFESAAAGAGASASAYSAAAVNATANLPFAIGSTLLGGAGNAAGKWWSYMRGGGGSPGADYSGYGGTAP